MTYSSSLNVIGCSFTPVKLYGFCNPSDIEHDVLQDRVSHYFQDVSAWRMANHIQLNPSKTEPSQAAVLLRDFTWYKHQLLTAPMQHESASAPTVSTDNFGFHVNSNVTLITCLQPSEPFSQAVVICSGH